MPQGVVKGKKIDKKAAANKHGKGDRAGSRKGKLEKPPKQTRLLKQYKDNQELTKMINATNEANVASKAETGGGKLKALKAGPPVLAPKSGKAKKQAAATEVEEGMDED